MKIKQFKTVIREIVREEIRLGLKEIIGELNQPKKEVTQPQTKKKVVEKKYSDNSILNDVLNETAQDGDWKTLGGGEFTTERMNDIVGKNYGDLMNGTPQKVPSSDPMSQFLNKDYTKVLEKTKEISDKKHGG